MKKLLKILSMAVLVMIAVLNKTDVWAAENTADNSQIQINIKIATMNFHYSHWKKTEISLSETRIFIEFFIMIKL